MTRPRVRLRRWPPWSPPLPRLFLRLLPSFLRPSQSEHITVFTRTLRRSRIVMYIMSSFGHTFAQPCKYQFGLYPTCNLLNYLKELTSWPRKVSATDVTVFSLPGSLLKACSSDVLLNMPFQSDLLPVKAFWHGTCLRITHALPLRHKGLWQPPFRIRQLRRIVLVSLLRLLWPAQSITITVLLAAARIRVSHWETCSLPRHFQPSRSSQLRFTPFLVFLALLSRRWTSMCPAFSPDFVDPDSELVLKTA